MFSQMVYELQSGKMPESNLLRKRFEAALTKKMGVIKTPYSFWPVDTKINPSAKQLLWAAILLHDKENFRVVEAIISTEIEEKQRAKGQPDNIQFIKEKVRLLLREYIEELIELGPDKTFKKNLRSLIEELLPAIKN